MARSLSPETSELDQSIMHLLHRGCQIADTHFARSTREITTRQFVVIEAVARHPGASQTDLCGMTGVDRSTLADIVKRLLRKGLLQRRRTRNDARAYDVRLTGQGQDLLQRLRDSAKVAEHQLLTPLSTSERSHLVALLQRLTVDGGERAADSNKAA